MSAIWAQAGENFPRTDRTRPRGCLPGLAPTAPGGGGGPRWGSPRCVVRGRRRVGRPVGTRVLPGPGLATAARHLQRPGAAGWPMGGTGATPENVDSSRSLGAWALLAAPIGEQAPRGGAIPRRGRRRRPESPRGGSPYPGPVALGRHDLVTPRGHVRTAVGRGSGRSAVRRRVGFADCAVRRRYGSAKRGTPVGDQGGDS